MIKPLAIALVLFGYLLGSMLPAVWFVSRYSGKSPWDFQDNPGGAGVWRLVDPIPSILTVMFDMAKGIVPLIMAMWLGIDDYRLVAVSVSPVIGHNWSVFHKFRGGRGMACAIGVLLVLSWRDIVPGLIIGIIAALLVKWAPTVGVVGFPLGIASMIIGSIDPVLVASAVSTVIVVTIRQIPWLVERLSSRSR